MNRLRAPLVLASASPRRRQILTQLGLPFRAEAPRVDEVRREGESAEQFVERAATDKALAVAARLGAQSPPPFVLGADTIVVVDAEVLGKPADDAEALAMIRRLSGRAHRVLTAIAVVQPGRGLLGRAVVGAEVEFEPLTEASMRAYVDSAEGRDKAGAYAVQGLGAGLVRSVHGPYHAVVGLPASQTVALLRQCGALERWP